MKNLLRVIFACAFLATASATSTFTATVTSQYPQTISIALMVNNAGAITKATLLGSYFQDTTNNGTILFSTAVGSPPPAGGAVQLAGTPVMQIDCVANASTSVTAAGVTATLAQIGALIQQAAAQFRTTNP